MNILITSQSLEPNGTSHVSASAGKVSAYVSQFRKSFVTVVCRNAASRRMGAGRTFHGPERFDEALAAYKSPEMKAIIRTARSVFEENADPVIAQDLPDNVVPFCSPEIASLMESVNRRRSDGSVSPAHTPEAHRQLVADYEWLESAGYKLDTNDHWQKIR